MRKTETRIVSGPRCCSNYSALSSCGRNGSCVAGTPISGGLASTEETACLWASWRHTALCGRPSQHPHFTERKRRRRLRPMHGDPAVNHDAAVWLTSEGPAWESGLHRCNLLVKKKKKITSLPVRGRTGAPLRSVGACAEASPRPALSGLSSPEPNVLFFPAG